jgi:hypothetical protein
MMRTCRRLTENNSGYMDTPEDAFSRSGRGPGGNSGEAQSVYLKTASASDEELRQRLRT